MDLFAAIVRFPMRITYCVVVLLLVLAVLDRHDGFKIMKFGFDGKRHIFGGNCPVLCNVISSEVNDEGESSPRNTYCVCGRCGSAYPIEASLLKPSGSQVVCEVCKAKWFLTPNDLKTETAGDYFSPMPQKRIELLKRSMKDKSVRVGSSVSAVKAEKIFVSGLLASIEEKEIAELFAEYGVLDVQLVRDTQKVSKGFAFIDVRTLVHLINFCCYLQ